LTETTLSRSGERADILAKKDRCCRALLRDLHDLLYLFALPEHKRCAKTRQITIERNQRFGEKLELALGATKPRGNLVVKNEERENGLMALGGAYKRRVVMNPEIPGKQDDGRRHG
jgi:hypothetical protein